jgi:Ca2+-binding EF-hand superfamily protein
MSQTFSRILLTLGLVICPLAILPSHAQEAGKTGGLRNKMQNLQKLDTNGDGGISRQEYNAVRAEAFKRLDRNNDGQLSLDEFLSDSGDRFFERLDTNKDGIVTREEMQQLRERMRAFKPQ